MRFSILFLLATALPVFHLIAQGDPEINLFEISFVEYAEDIELTPDQLDELAALQSGYLADTRELDSDVYRGSEIPEAFQGIAQDYRQRIRAKLTDEQFERLYEIWLTAEIDRAQAHFMVQGLEIELNREQAIEVIRLSQKPVDENFDATLLAILDEEQAVKYQRFKDRGFTNDDEYIDKRRQSLEDGIAVFQIINETYINGLREIRTRLQPYLSAVDSRNLATLRRLRNQQADHIVQMLEEEMRANNEAPKDLMDAALGAISYTFLQFPQDYSEEFPAPEMPQIDWDTAMVQSLVNRHRETLAPFELFIYEVTDDTRRTMMQFFETVDEAQGLDVEDEIGGMFLWPKDSLSAAFIEVFLLMEPLDLEGDMGNSDHQNPFGLTAYPSPARTTQTIEFQLPTEGQIVLEIIDQGGKILNTLQRGRLPAGEHRFDTDVSQLPDGIHFYRLTHPGGVSSLPIVVER